MLAEVGTLAIVFLVLAIPFMLGLVAAFIEHEHRERASVRARRRSDRMVL